MIQSARRLLRELNKAKEKQESYISDSNNKIGNCEDEENKPAIIRRADLKTPTIEII